jgi:hypothetical protein
VHLQEFEQQISKKEVGAKFENERVEEISRIARQLFGPKIQPESFVAEQGVELAQALPGDDNWYQRSLTPFINYWGVDLAICDDSPAFKVIVRSSIDNEQHEYAHVGESFRIEDMDESTSFEEKEAAKEEVVDIFQAFARCFGVE